MVLTLVYPTLQVSQLETDLEKADLEARARDAKMGVLEEELAALRDQAADLQAALDDADKALSAALAEAGDRERALAAHREALQVCVLLLFAVHLVCIRQAFHSLFIHGDSTNSAFWLCFFLYQGVYDVAAASAGVPANPAADTKLQSNGLMTVGAGKALPLTTSELDRLNKAVQDLEDSLAKANGKLNVAGKALKHVGEAAADSAGVQDRGMELRAIGDDDHDALADRAVPLVIAELDALADLRKRQQELAEQHEEALAALARAEVSPACLCRRLHSRCMISVFVKFPTMGMPVASG